MVIMKYMHQGKEVVNQEKKCDILSIDPIETIESYLEGKEWRIRENANQGFSLGGLIINTAGKVTANYWLNSVYDTEVSTAHREGDLHIHDLSLLGGYCAGWSLRVLLEEGFNGVPSKVESNSPKNLSTALGQMVNFFGTLQNEWAGAQAFSSFDTYLAPFVKKYELELSAELTECGVIFSSDSHRDTYIEAKVKKYVYDCMQAFVFNCNVPSRWGSQTPFTNITFDWNCPKDLAPQRLFLGGAFFSYTFGELEKEMQIINEAFLQIMLSGDAKGRVFTFPIPTYNITNDFDWDHPNSTLLFEMTAKYGLPYFQNFVNSELKPGDVRSMCCRLQLDVRELLKRGNGLFGSAEMTGSIGVVTINAVRLGYTYAGKKEALTAELVRLMELAKESLETKRSFVQKWMDKGLYPYTKRYLGKLKNHFSTIGINGLNEAVRNYFDDKEDITTSKGRALSLEILDVMRGKLVEFQEETGHMYNLEATPSEGTTQRFAKEDQKRFPDILQAGTEMNPYYTNSSQLPVEFTQDAFEALYHQDEFQKKYTGGTVLHLYMRERISDAEACKKLVKKAFEHFHLPYLTITPTFSICPKHGYLSGEHEYCYICDDELGVTPDQAEKLRVDHSSHTSERKKTIIHE